MKKVHTVSSSLQICEKISYTRIQVLCHPCCLVLSLRKHLLVKACAIDHLLDGDNAILIGEYMYNLVDAVKSTRLLDGQSYINRVAVANRYEAKAPSSIYNPDQTDFQYYWWGFEGILLHVRNTGKYRHVLSSKRQHEKHLTCNPMNPSAMPFSIKSILSLQKGLHAAFIWEQWVEVEGRQ